MGFLPVDIAIRKESSPASDGRPTALPAAFPVVCQWSAMSSSLITLWGRVVDGLFGSTEKLHDDESAPKREEDWPICRVVGRCRMNEQGNVA